MTAAQAFRPDGDGVVLSVRVTPNAAADRIEGMETRDDGSAALRIRVTAPPDKGKANKAVITLLAKRLHMPKSAISLVSGETARNKLLRLAGDPEDLIAALTAL